MKKSVKNIIFIIEKVKQKTPQVPSNNNPD